MIGYIKHYIIFFIVNQWIALVGLKELSIKINVEDINFK